MHTLKEYEPQTTDMNPLEYTGEFTVRGVGLVKYAQEVKTEKGYMYKYLVQIQHRSGAKSTMTCVKFTDAQEKMIDKDVLVLIGGNLYEAKYMKKGEWHTNGLQVRLQSIDTIGVEAEVRERIRLVKEGKL